MPEYQELGKGMNLGQMGQLGYFKAYVREFNAQNNSTPKMDEFLTIFFFLRWAAKVGGGLIVQFPKVS